VIRFLRINSFEAPSTPPRLPRRMTGKPVPSTVKAKPEGSGVGLPLYTPRRTLIRHRCPRAARRQQEKDGYRFHASVSRAVISLCQERYECQDFSTQTLILHLTLTNDFRQTIHTL